MTINIILADDHPLIRSGIRLELTQQEDIHVLSEAVNSDEALALTLKYEPEILIIDVNMPGTPVYKIIQKIKSTNPTIKILVLSSYSDFGTVSAMLQAGAEGYILKDDNPDIIVQAVNPLHQGETCYSRQIQTMIDEMSLDNQDITPIMSDRECSLLKLLVDGFTNKEISVSLCIAERTVEFHMDKIMEKLGVRSRTSVAIWAQEHQFLLTKT